MKKIEIIYHCEQEVEATFTFPQAESWREKELVIGADTLVQYTIHVPGISPIIFNRAFSAIKVRESFEKKLDLLLTKEEDVYIRNAHYEVRDFLMW